MPTDLLRSLLPLVEDDLDEVEAGPDGLSANVSTRYGEVVLRVEHDEEAESLRVGVAIPPPAGAGRAFLIFCLSLDARYWDVKVGLDDAGFLLLHSDLSAPESEDHADLASLLVERSDAVIDLLDDDLVGFMLEHDLGTPAQVLRWRDRAPEVVVDDDDEE